MSKRTVYHVTKGGNWNNKKEGAAPATAPTKQDAIQRAVGLARRRGGPAQGQDTQRRWQDLKPNAPTGRTLGNTSANGHYTGRSGSVREVDL